MEEKDKRKCLALGISTTRSLYQIKEAAKAIEEIHPKDPKAEMRLRKAVEDLLNYVALLESDTSLAKACGLPVGFEDAVISLREFSRKFERVDLRRALDELPSLQERIRDVQEEAIAFIIGELAESE